MKEFLPHVEAKLLLTQRDSLTFAISLFTICVLPIFLGRLKKNRSKNAGRSKVDCLMVGRKITMPFFVASLVSTWYGGIFGVTRISFEQGVYHFLSQGLFWHLSYLVFAFYIVDQVFKYPQARSLAHLVELIFGKGAARTCAILNLLNVLPTVYVISLGSFLYAVFGFSVFFWMLLSTMIIGLYTAAGGFKAVVVSDFYQFMAMMFAVLSVLFFSFKDIASPAQLFASLPASHLDPLGGESVWQLLVWGFIALTTLVDPNFYQRCLASPSPQFAKRGILYSIVFWVVIDICTCLSGLYAKLVIPEAASQSAYLLYSLQVLPEGLRGVFCSGMVAMIVSTTDSYLFTASQVLSQDLLKLQSVWWQRFSVLFIAFLTLALANQLDGNIKEVWKFFGSLSSACLFIPVVIGFLKKDFLDARTFQISCYTSMMALFIWKFLIPSSVSESIDPFYLGALTSLLICLKPFRVSVYFSKKSNEIRS
ncbi:MAG: sodium:solute symporter family protein [Oligoflexales bacterium]|nr:sodium:solute symporter family protein [Oligoflexales bacterium]